MGDSGVGKTSSNRISSNTFSPCTEATIGASYFQNNMQRRYNLNMGYDEEKYRCLVPLYYNNADVNIYMMLSKALTVKKNT